MNENVLRGINYIAEKGVFFFFGVATLVMFKTLFFFFKGDEVRANNGIDMVVIMLVVSMALHLVNRYCDKKLGVER